MGLDMYAYAVVQGGQRDGEEESLADWRKHNRLHGWMEDLWEDKGRPYQGNLDELGNGFGSDFNCVPLELTSEDLDQLESGVNEKVLPETGGFFLETILLVGKMMMANHIKKEIIFTKKRI